MTFPDTIGLLRSHLATVAAPVAVATRVPRDRPDKLVQIRRVGGTPLTVRDVVRVDLFAWAPTEPEATTLGHQMRAAVWALAGTATLGPACYRVTEFMGPRMDDDPDTGTPRLWITFELHVRADDVIHKAP